MRRTNSAIHFLLTTTGILFIIFLAALSTWSSIRISDIKEIPGGSLQEIRQYQAIFAASIIPLLLGLAGLILLNRKRRNEQPLSERPVFEPNAHLQSWLGPIDSARRRALLALVPGLGQAAVGRWARAAVLVMAWLLPGIGGYLLYQDILRRDLSASYFVVPILPTLATVTTASLALTLLLAVFAGADALRLDEPERHPARWHGGRLLSLLSLPLLAAGAGMAAQILMGGWGGEKFPRLAGWGFGSAGLFAAMAWGLRSRPRAIVGYGAIGLPVGLIAMYINTRIPVPTNGFLLYRSLINGFLIGSAVYLLFKTRGLSTLAIPAGMAGAWMGNLAVFLVLTAISQGRFKNVFSLPVMRGLTLFEFYFIGLALLLVAFSVRGREMRVREPVSPDPLRDGEQGGWPIFDASSRRVQRMWIRNRPPMQDPPDEAAPIPSPHSAPQRF
ncbi:MAG TPA: hypothetical protein VI702_04795 [Nitrospiria bacterium]